MLKKFLLTLTSLLCVTCIFFGCKSTPEPTSDLSEDEIVQEVESIVEEIAQVEEITEEEALARAQDEIEQAKKNKARIEGLEFIDYDSTSYEAGCALLAAYDETSESIPALARMELAKKTNDTFKSVLSLGFSDLATKKKAEVVPVKENCIQAKAQNACKEAFDAANFDLRAADEYFDTEKYEMSYDSYSKALIGFTELYDDIFRKKALADEAIEKAKNRTNEVEEFAFEADKISPLPEDSESAE